MLPATPAQNPSIPHPPPRPCAQAEVAAAMGTGPAGGSHAQVQTELGGTSILFPQGLNNILGLFATSAEQNLHPACIIHVRTTGTRGHVLDLPLY